jgi:gliding motility-associated-like protein
MDAFPNDPNESKDTDGDGIGDNTDLDKNNDGYPEGRIFVSSVLTPKSTGAESMWKVINIDEYNYSVIKIFSPDGSIVFKVVNYKNDWGGTHYDTGEALPTGPYLYQIYLGKDQDPISGWLYIFN